MTIPKKRLISGINRIVEAQAGQLMTFCRLVSYIINPDMKPKPAPYGKRLSARLSAELAEATAAYGQEMIIDRFRPLTGADRNRWERARRKPGRPRRGKGARVISVSVEQDLLLRADELARALGLSRARLIERGLRIALAANGK
jgi:hypothetical protein